MNTLVAIFFAAPAVLLVATITQPLVYPLAKLIHAALKLVDTVFQRRYN